MWSVINVSMNIYIQTELGKWRNSNLVLSSKNYIQNIHSSIVNAVNIAANSCIHTVNLDTTLNRIKI